MLEFVACAFGVAPNNGEPPSPCLVANINAVNAVSNLNVKRVERGWSSTSHWSTLADYAIPIWTYVDCHKPIHHEAGSSAFRGRRPLLLAVPVRSLKARPTPPKALAAPGRCRAHGADRSCRRRSVRRGFSVDDRENRIRCSVWISLVHIGDHGDYLLT
jgi:hypothetical protein